MCGIFGVVLKESTSISDIRSLVSELFKLAEKRGRDASGIAVMTDSSIRVLKKPIAARRFIKSQEFERFLTESIAECRGKSIVIIGHARLVTSGSHGRGENNQPVVCETVVGIHNGILVNELEIRDRFNDLPRTTLLDSEAIFRLIDRYRKEDNSLHSVIDKVHSVVEGESSIAFLDATMSVLGLYSNVGGVYFAATPGRSFIFASEKFFLSKIVRNRRFKDLLGGSDIKQLRPRIPYIVSRTCEIVSRDSSAMVPKPNVRDNQVNLPVIDTSSSRPDLHRCTRCILPHTFPNISFDSEGVCSVCRDYRPDQHEGVDALKKIVERYKTKGDDANCIVALSGGRDSCYGLHYVKNELGLRPIAFTYDWAMVTDVARRNCSQMCAALGVEHIVRSADIAKKRRNIRMNIDAWLHRPKLGVIPLFMAGDKQFFHYASSVSKQTGIPLVFFCAGNNLELTRFKTGFAGVSETFTNGMLGLGPLQRIQLLLYYVREAILNPRYINRSLLDSLFAFYSTYIHQRDFVYLYRYVKWDGEVIERTLEDQYGWRSPEDSPSSWRIGDGTAAFYNYIYGTVAGFTEHDTFRSNQIRERQITREEALALVELDNVPRFASIEEYARQVGFNMDDTLAVIANIPKLQ